MLQSAQIPLSAPLSELSCISASELKLLQAAALYSVQDVLLRVPRRYEDRRHSKPIASIVNGETVNLQVHVYSAGWRFSYKRYFELSVGAEGDPHGARLSLRWFNMPYIAKVLAVGMRLSVYGKIKEYAGKLTMTNPDFEIIEDEDVGLRLVQAAMGEDVVYNSAAVPAPSFIHTARIVPIYRGISGMTARVYRSLMWKLLQQLQPESCTELYDIAPTYSYYQALQDIHFPNLPETSQKARMRFALSECFRQQFTVAWKRRRSQRTAGQITATTGAYVEELCAALPFSLTQAQRRCVQEIRADMQKPFQMNRLLQGDVGSGKTLVALCAMLLAVESGKTAAMLAPTQILAEQHYRHFRKLLSHTDVRLSLRTSDRVDDSDFLAEDSPADDEPRILIGTHALLYKKNRPTNLGLAVIDEQHKFGVAQRERFISSGVNPDVLVMTATPIPRTLTLTLYGDLDVSVIDELPANRGEVVTALRAPSAMKKILRFIKDELDQGRQIYVVSPLIDENESRSQSSVTKEWEKWKEWFPHVGVGLLHGRLSAEEKDDVMAAFRAAETSILIATTVVEVGVDVPNATVMLINDADSFGLSQLHQLRGRIGRGCHKSYCILLSSVKAGEPGYDKLNVLCRTRNGFTIAEEDFKLRGPGDVLGTAQSGLSHVRFAEWLTDMRLIHRANRQAAAILDADPFLVRPEHLALRQLISDTPDAATVS